MIPLNPAPWEPRLWRAELGQALRSSRALLEFVGVERADVIEAEDFPTLVPRGYARRMQSADPLDPLLAQVLARQDETLQVEGFTADPLEELRPDRNYNPAAGLLHKYKGRALLIATGACAINCRYCFRRHFPYGDQRGDQLEAALARLREDSTITEVILSGGDPLLLDDPALARLVADITDIPQIERLRIHSRIPVVLPERITAALLETLTPGRLKVSMVVHVNHARELDENTARAFACLKRIGVWLFNQAVLLRGVNDTLEAQVDLAQTLFAQDVLPYYLHLPDRVAGTQHFFVDAAAGKALHGAMQGELPGYLVPRLVREEPGAASKVHI